MFSDRFFQHLQNVNFSLKELSDVIHLVPFFSSYRIEELGLCI